MDCEGRTRRRAGGASSGGTATCLPRPVQFVAWLAALAAVLLVPASRAHAQAPPVLVALEKGNVYLTPHAGPGAHIRPGDRGRLVAAASQAAAQGVPEKLAIVSSLPPQDPTPALAAHHVRNFLHFSGVVVLAAPAGIGLSSDRLSSSELTQIADAADHRCSISVTQCTIYAGRQAVARVKADQSSRSSSSRSAGIIVAIVVVLILAVILFTVWRRRRRRSGRLGDLRRAADATVSQADSAVLEIENAASANGMAPDVRQEYDRALGLRNGARAELERAASPEALIQANQDAAQAVLGLQGVMRRLGIESALTNPLDAAGHRCFYCARDDRPPYTQRTIDDGRGNSMQVDVCSVCNAQLEAGRTPHVATSTYNGTVVPWWAMPGNPYYYAYGGPSWQYWLPFFVGMDFGSWMGGGWNYGYGGYPGYGDWDNDGGQAQYDPSAGAIDTTPSDAGGADFGTWGDQGAGGDWGSGGSDWGGDSGGGDWGTGGGDWGGDSGGGDWGGGGGDWGSGGGDWGSS